MTPRDIATFIAERRFLSLFWTASYVAKDTQRGFQQPWLNNLTEADFEADTKLELVKLDRYLGTISLLPGFKKLRPGVRSKDLEQFDSTVVEVKTLTWLARLGLLKEIRPQLPVGTGESDFRIDLEGQEIYGEVWQPRVLAHEWVIKGSDFSMAVADQRDEAPKRLRTLKGKGDSQLPMQVNGVWVAHVYHTALRRAWIHFFREDMQGRPNVLGVAIWTSIGSSSTRIALEGTRLTKLADDRHEIYWVANQHASNASLQQHLLNSLRS